MISKLTIGEALSQITEELTGISDTPHLDAELLLMNSLNQSKAHLLAYPENQLTAQQMNNIAENLKRRKQGEPMAYILGHKEFWSLDFEVTPDVLIPRPETEHLVEWTLNHLPEKEKIYVADLGVGSGAIAVALAYERPGWEIHATETSPAALKIARINAEKYQLSNIQFYSGHWCEPLPRRDYSAILSNPPYIDENDPHLETLKFEPREALNGGKEGIESISEIVPQAWDFLAENGYLIIEHGYDQKDKVIALMENVGYKNVEDHQDLAGKPRFVIGKKKSLTSPISPCFIEPLTKGTSFTST